ncbi:hypothetical protein [[Mycobacterium] wendilense]|uniref:Transmembrane protein n=1 Tax=[Mycobacterium] wendilense TaxID=3064284 RepID=A0ABN9P3Z4_9MYCO|nr:hypothetical protein [Mycolicibacterium sp. MU0050]CAJ1584907.1 hypothetical protein MU0050_003436 [Mycolicibacterium sp. MU0050]
MGTTRPRRRGDRLGQEDAEVRSAIRFAAIATLVGVAFLVVAAVWVSGCDGATTDADSVACGGPQRTVLGLGAPAIMMGSGLWAFYRTYRVWRAEGTWWGWQGAGWFLMMVMLITLMGVPAMIGPILGN